MNSPIPDPRLIQTEITYEDFVKWFPKEIMSNIYYWLLCGDYGDPMACKDIYKILEYIAEHSPGNIQVNTNGGLRSKTLYRQIGELFAQKKPVNGVIPKRVITFSIDGLEDTNHIYRRNVKWSRVWENLLAYVETGALAHWDFLQFKHNVHQIEKARELAYQHGMIFILKNPFGVDGQAMPAYDKNLKLDYVIEHANNNGYPPYVPADPRYIAPKFIPIKVEGSIDCMSSRKAPVPYHDRSVVEIYIDALGRVLPCCFVGVRMLVTHSPEAIQVQEIQSQMENKNSLHHHSLKEILDSKVLDIYSKSWKSKSIGVCWNQCGKSIDKDRKIDSLFKDAK
jgi:MoaA/NifB/PqqE/SkfB family radical SAM enzyme